MKQASYELFSTVHLPEKKRIVHTLQEKSQGLPWLYKCKLGCLYGLLGFRANELPWVDVHRIGIPAIPLIQIYHVLGYIEVDRKYCHVLID